MKKFTNKFILGILAFAPALAFGQSTGPNLGNIETLMRSIARLIDLALPMVVALALLAFFWSLMRFIFAAHDEDKRKDAKSMMIYSIVALFVMVAIWGLVGFLGQAIGIQPGQNSGNIPRVQGL